LPFYVVEKFKWSETSIGLLGIFLGLAYCWRTGRTGAVDDTLNLACEKIYWLALPAMVLALILISFNNTPWLMYAFMIPYCIGGIGGTAMQGFISEHVSPKEQGELQGALTSLVSVTTIIGPLMMTSYFPPFHHKRIKSVFSGSTIFIGCDNDGYRCYINYQKF
jgi:DHA1 family tetracycline resistance protein-like MFS transporter